LNLVLLGPPGAGKGTQAEKIRERCGVVHVSTGDLFRAALKDKSDLGRQVKEYLESGRLVPDEVTSAMVARRLDDPDCMAGYVLDGYPRTLKQAADLNGLLKERGRKLDVVVYFGVTEATAVERLSGRRLCKQCGAGYHVVHMPTRREGRCDECGGDLIRRTDDEPDTVRDRLEVYAEQTSTLVEEYEKQGILSRIDANGSPDDVTEATMAALDAIGYRRATAGRSEA